MENHEDRCTDNLGGIEFMRCVEETMPISSRVLVNPQLLASFIGSLPQQVDVDHHQSSGRLSLSFVLTALVAGH